MFFKFHLTYYPTRITSTLGSQLVCNAIKAVCNAYKVLKIKREDTVPLVHFKPHRAVHFDKRTYSFIEGVLSLYTLAGRILVPFTAASS